VERPAGLVAEQLQQHVLAFLRGLEGIPRSLRALPDPPGSLPHPQYLLVQGTEFVGCPLLEAGGEVLAGGGQVLAEQTPPLGAAGSGKGIRCLGSRRGAAARGREGRSREVPDRRRGIPARIREPRMEQWGCSGSPGINEIPGDPRSTHGSAQGSGSRSPGDPGRCIGPQAD